MIPLRRLWRAIRMMGDSQVRPPLAILNSVGAPPRFEVVPHDGFDGYVFDAHPDYNAYWSTAIAAGLNLASAVSYVVAGPHLSILFWSENQQPLFGLRSSADYLVHAISRLSFVSEDVRDGLCAAIAHNAVPAEGQEIGFATLSPFGASWARNSFNTFRPDRPMTTEQAASAIAFLVSSLAGRRDLPGLTGAVVKQLEGAK